VYTTKGTLALTSNQSEATFGFASKYVYMTNVTYDLQVHTLYAICYMLYAICYMLYVICYMLNAVLNPPLDAIYLYVYHIKPSSLYHYAMYHTYVY
jgi:hypothetical protein